MTPPFTLQPNRLQESVAANESTSTQIFGVMCITLTSLIDSMVPVSKPWALLAPILWWALPAGIAGRPPASSQELSTGWIPDSENNRNLLHGRQNGHSRVARREIQVMRMEELQVKSARWLNQSDRS
ncbi:hypothetical protein DSO57_1033893 [Entomophthora muscae]|uniref:Uncharacterized protein n=1 Tax=Entomophthora muscae TaxID=34485 RepID=A0ACC2TME0_9FUNG|nr:hypothetical protein DSO57_1033893 [Entomophthora muscae]